MYTELSKTERKKAIKVIEKHLKKYNSYKIAIINMKEQLDRIQSRNTTKTNTLTLSENL
mgnify:CR=1 FL=1